MRFDYPLNGELAFSTLLDAIIYIEPNQITEIYPPDQIMIKGNILLSGDTVSLELDNGLLLNEVIYHHHRAGSVCSIDVVAVFTNGDMRLTICRSEIKRIRIIERAPVEYHVKKDTEIKDYDVRTS